MKMWQLALLLTGLALPGMTVETKASKRNGIVDVPSIAIDLPLKILVWQDGQGKVWLSYNNPNYLQQRHGVPDDLLNNIAVIGMLATQAGE